MMELALERLSKMNENECWEHDMEKSMVSIKDNEEKGKYVVRYDKANVHKEFSYETESDDEGAQEEAYDYWSFVSRKKRLTLNMFMEMYVKNGNYYLISLKTGLERHFPNDVMLIDKDDESIELLDSFKWFFNPADGHVISFEKSKKIYFHLKLKGISGSNPDKVVHFDGDKMNNTRNNLKTVDEAKKILKEYEERQKAKAEKAKIGEACKAKCLICCEKLEGCNVWRCNFCKMGVCARDMKFILEHKLDKENCSCCLVKFKCPNCESRQKLDHTEFTDLELIKLHADLYHKMISKVDNSDSD